MRPVYSVRVMRILSCRWPRRSLPYSEPRLGRSPTSVRPKPELPYFLPSYHDSPLVGSYRTRDDPCVTSQDRKSVVSGKSVSVRVDLGGRRLLKKKKKYTN